MKKWLFLILVFIVFQNWILAQNYDLHEHLRFDIGIGVPYQHSSHSGVIGSMELGYMFNKQIKGGFRIEGALLNMSNIGSWAFTIDYYLTRNFNFRPFAGGGYSNFTVADAGGCGVDPGMPQAIRTTKNSGAIARIGFEVRHFRFAVEYNFVPSTYVSNRSTDNNILGDAVYSNSYLGVKIGVYFGGVKKKKADKIQ